MRKCETESHVCVLCVFGSYFIQVKERFTRNNEQSGEAYIHTYQHIRVFNYYDDGGHFMEDPKRERERK